MVRNEKPHQLERDCDGGYSCPVCIWSWVRKPRGTCPGVPHYGYGDWPEDLYTFTQLRRMKLRPGGGPDGCYFIMKSPYRRYLYSKEKAMARRVPTERQREAIEKMRAGLIRRYTCTRCGYYDASHGKGKDWIRVYKRWGLCENCNDLRVGREKQARIAAWAHGYLHGPEFVVLDTETTGLNDEKTDEIIELALVHSSGTILFSSLIQTQDPQRQDLVTHIHGITREMLDGAPTFAQVWPQIKAIIRRYRNILVYNAAFDRDLLRTTAKRYGYEVPKAYWTCLMQEYAVYHGACSSYWKSYTWQKLVVAAERLEVEIVGELHRAETDARLCLDVLKALSALHGHIELLPPPEPEPELDLGDWAMHPF